MQEIAQTFVYGDEVVLHRGFLMVKK